MAVKFNTIARSKLMNSVGSAPGEDFNYNLRYYACAPTMLMRGSSRLEYNYAILGSVDIILTRSADGKSLTLKGSSSAATALQTSRIQSWALYKGNSWAISGFSVASQSSGRSANLIVNSVDAVEGSPIQLVDFTLTVN